MSKNRRIHGKLLPNISKIFPIFQLSFQDFQRHTQDVHQDDVKSTGKCGKPLFPLSFMLCLPKSMNVLAKNA